MEKKYVSLEEANNLLPEIAIALNKLNKIRTSLELTTKINIGFEDDYKAIVNSVNTNKYVHKLNYEFYKVISELLELGCVVKDIELGIADFYSKNNGKEIFLCWRLGESDVSFWHEVGSSFSGRKPISLLKRV